MLYIDIVLLDISRVSSKGSLLQFRFDIFGLQNTTVKPTVSPGPNFSNTWMCPDRFLS